MRDGVRAVSNLGYAESILLQNFVDEQPHHRVIIHQQDFCGLVTKYNELVNSVQHHLQSGVHLLKFGGQIFDLPVR